MIRHLIRPMLLNLLALPLCTSSYADTLTFVREVVFARDLTPVENIIISPIGQLLFFTEDGPGTGREVWVSDGTEVGTRILKDINPGPGDGIGAWFAASMNGILYFRATDGSSGFELWRSDGTTGGTYRLKDINPGAEDSAPLSFVVVANTLYFKALSVGTELWKTDGTEAGTLPVDSEPFNIKHLIAYDGSLFFQSFGGELWRSDGTDASTSVVADPNMENEPMAVSGGLLFFNGVDVSAGKELWVSDGTLGGTGRLADLWPGVDDSNPRDLIDAGDTLFLLADDGVLNNSELFASDGTPGGTGLVKDVNPGPLGPDIRFMTNVNGTLFFSAFGGELWSSDGSNVGTQFVSDLSLSINGMEAYVNRAYMTVNGCCTGLYKSDGTGPGTTAAIDDLLAPDGAGQPSVYGEMTVMDDRLFITGGSQLWIVPLEDEDGDGLSDSMEAILGTNPSLWDTDSDGVDDGTEVVVDGTDPLPEPEEFLLRITMLLTLMLLAAGRTVHRGV